MSLLSQTRALCPADISTAQRRANPGRTTPGRTTPGRAITALVDYLLDWQDRARERRWLQALPPALAKDLGADPAAVLAEAAKPFWRP